MHCLFTQGRQINLLAQRIKLLSLGRGSGPLMYFEKYSTLGSSFYRMFRIFRRIRAELMAGKHFHRYLLYAFGEILLVVVGILIALQIDNWNEERKEHRRETAILQKLHREFQANLADFNAIYELNQQKLRALDTVIHYMNNTHLPQAYDRIDETKPPTE